MRSNKYSFEDHITNITMNQLEHSALETQIILEETLVAGTGSKSSKTAKFK